MALAAGAGLLVPFGVATWDVDAAVWPYVAASVGFELAPSHVALALAVGACIAGAGMVAAYLLTLLALERAAGAALVVAGVGALAFA